MTQREIFEINEEKKLKKYVIIDESQVLHLTIEINQNIILKIIESN